MALQVRGVCELLVAHGALVRFLPSVNHHVPLQNDSFHKRHVAHVTLKLPLARVEAVVNFKARFGFVRLRAHDALERPVAHGMMNAYVERQSNGRVVVLAANLTLHRHDGGTAWNSANKSNCLRKYKSPISIPRGRQTSDGSILQPIKHVMSKNNTCKESE